MESILKGYEDKEAVILALGSYLKERYMLSNEQIAKIVAERAEILVPISIFKTGLCTLETLSIYLKDNLNLSFAKSAKLLKRSQKTLWSAYSRGKKKGWLIEAKKSRISIPLSVFANRRYSSMEALVKHLKEEYDLAFTEIANMLARNPKTIWTTYQNAKKKL